MTGATESAATARHDMEHALLSLIGSLATAATNGPATISLIGALLVRFGGAPDLDRLDDVAWQIYKTPAGRDMADVKRHAHELHEAIATYRRATDDPPRRRTTNEPAREHIRNARMMLASWRALGYSMADTASVCNDVDARMQRALDEILRGNP